MPEVTKAEMLTVLAERGMEWKPGWDIDHLERDEPWNPFVDPRAAFELLEAMRKKPATVWQAFVDEIWAILVEAKGRTGFDVLLEMLQPEHIARAAFEALNPAKEI